MNAVVIAVVVMLLLSLARMNVVLALFLGALSGGLSSQLGLTDTLAAFSSGIGNGTSIALSYALLGAFAMGISHSGIPGYLAEKVIERVQRSNDRQKSGALLNHGCHCPDGRGFPEPDSGSHRLYPYPDSTVAGSTQQYKKWIVV